MAAEEERLTVDGAPQCATDFEGFHTVGPGDTMQGICLRHGVSALEIRRLNQCTNANVVALKVVKLPGAGGGAHLNITTASKKAKLVQEFREESGEGVTEAEYYLEDHQWRVDLALAAWKNDDEWDAGNANGET